MTLVSIVQSPDSVALIADTLVTPGNLGSQRREAVLHVPVGQMVSKVQNIGNQVLGYSGEEKLILEAARAMSALKSIDQSYPSPEQISQQIDNIGFGRSGGSHLSAVSMSISGNEVRVFGDFYGKVREIKELSFVSTGSGFGQFPELFSEIYFSGVKLPEGIPKNFELLPALSLLNWQIIFSSEKMRLADWGGILDIWLPDTDGQRFHPFNDASYCLMYIYKENNLVRVEFASFLLSFSCYDARVVVENLTNSKGEMEFRTTILPSVTTKISDINSSIRESDIMRELNNRRPIYDTSVGIFLDSGNVQELTYWSMGKELMPVDYSFRDGSVIFNRKMATIEEKFLKSIGNIDDLGSRAELSAAISRRNSERRKEI
jgi:hypothetical protein